MSVLVSEPVLYLLALLYIIVTSTVNVALSARIAIKLHLHMAMLLALWPLTALVPACIEVHYLQIRMQAGIESGSPR